ncbi:MAG: potassium channel protein [Actinomycetota bacterium]|nr:potassium channel protein [Actinomycetota bacterium]
MKPKTNYRYLRRIMVPLLILVVLYFLGSLGYMVIEEMSPLDALFMTTITITTVGYETVDQLSTPGVVFTIIYIIIGTGLAAYMLISLADFILSEFLLGRMESRRITKMISKLRNHYIICGLGRVGLEIATELGHNQADFIVIDNAQGPIDICKENNWLYVLGDASNDDILLEAGIEEARSLFAALDTDPDNVYITLSAKSLNPDIFVVARATAQETISKLEKAGADRVLSPQIIGGRRMAAMAMQPLVTDFLDTIMGTENIEVRLLEIRIENGCILDGKTIKDASEQYNLGALIIAVIEPGKKTTYSKPDASTMLTSGQSLIAIGTKEQIQMLSNLATAD